MRDDFNYPYKPKRGKKGKDKIALVDAEQNRSHRHRWEQMGKQAWVQMRYR